MPTAAGITAVNRMLRRARLTRAALPWRNRSGVELETRGDAFCCEPLECLDSRLPAERVQDDPAHRQLAIIREGIDTGLARLLEVVVGRVERDPQRVRVSAGPFAALTDVRDQLSHLRRPDVH